MRSQSLRVAWMSGLALLVGGAGAVRADEIPAKYRPTIRKGLEWLAKNQAPDGHWDAPGGNHAVTMTSVAGMALLMEGSTLREGKYKDNVRKAVQWVMDQAMPSGQLGNPSSPFGRGGQYMYDHGFAMLFLASVVGEEEDRDRRAKLVEILEKAAKYSRDAQTNRGGWGYVSAKEMSNFDEGSVTITQVQGLRAIRNAGIAVPAEAIDDARKYLEKSTNAQGGVIYSLANGAGGGGRPALTAAAIACGYSVGDYKSPLIKKWFQFCKNNLHGIGAARGGFHDEYTNYYFAQAVYGLGDKGWARLFPESSPGERLTWSKWRDEAFENLMRRQTSDGSWTGGHAGAVFTTSCYLTIMQLDNAVLPIYQR